MIPLSVFPFPSAPCHKRVVSYPIIAFCCQSFNLSVAASPLRRLRASSPRGRALGRPGRFLLDEQSFILSGTVVPCGLDSRQLYKARFFRSLCPRKRGPAFCASIRFQRPVQSVPARQVPLPLGEVSPKVTERAAPLPTQKEGRTAVRSSLRSALIQPWSRALPLRP